MDNVQTSGDALREGLRRVAALKGTLMTTSDRAFAVMRSTTWDDRFEKVFREALPVPERLMEEADAEFRQRVAARQPFATIAKEMGRTMDGVRGRAAALPFLPGTAVARYGQAGTAAARLTSAQTATIEGAMSASKRR